MLILTRKPGESLYIGDKIKVTVVEIKGNQIRIGVDAPSEFRIFREEIFVQILEENRQAAQSVGSKDEITHLTEAWRSRPRAGQQAGTTATSDSLNRLSTSRFAGSKGLKGSNVSRSNSSDKDSDVVVRRNRGKLDNE
jgi:carbon storage regulator